MDSRGKTVLANILPADRASYISLLQRSETWKTAQEYRWYPTLSMSRRDANKVMDLEIRSKNSLCLSDRVMQSWVWNDNNTDPFEPIITVPRRIGWYQEEYLNDAEKLSHFFDKLLTSQGTTRKARYIFIVPILSSSCVQGLYCRGFTVFDSESGMCLDVLNKEAMSLFKSKIVENIEVIKFVIDAKFDLYLLHVFAECSPKNFHCLTTAAVVILEKLGFELPVDFDNSSERKQLFPFVRYWNVADISHVNVSCVYHTVVSHEFLRTAKGYTVLLAMLMRGSQLILSEEENWRIVFKYNKLTSIQRLQPFLTLSLGLNFWPSLNQCIIEELDIKLYVLAFLFENFCADQKLVYGEASYREALPTYRTLKYRFSTMFEKNYEYLKDEPCQNADAFAKLLVNVLKFDHMVDISDRMGTLGELLRRIERFVPNVMNM